ncbi:MAG: response regulator, partial [Syntrophobacteraceae bacterium]|nr:response regulator [Syntrophobacteraceae bacterium]
LTHSLLAFSRKQVLSIEPVNVNGVIENISKLLSRIMGEHIEVKTNLSAIPLHVMADKGQLEQVLMNLATNSRDVMPEGGCFVVSTEMVELDDSYTQLGDYLQAGKYVSISVSDTGFGMDEETRQKIFEPFFTTKEAGKGTGLGLSIVYGIIKQHKGFAEVQSSRGKGTTFRLLLPMVDEGAERPEFTARDKLASGGSETILVAEDNEAVRDLIKDVLEKSGYRVIHAVDGEDAVARFNENPQAIDLALLDVVMPKKGGVRVFEELQRGKPNLKVLFMTGYVSDVDARREISEKGLSFLKKPLSLEELLFKIREILDR